MNDLLTLDLDTLPFVPFADLHMLPSQPGIYFALDADGVPLYIGASVHLRRRWTAHKQRPRLIAMNCATVAYHLCNKEELFLFESLVIQRFNPVLNTPWRLPKEKPPGCTMKRINLFISDPQYDAMSTLAKDRDLPLAELVRRAIDVYLLRENAISATDIDPKTFSRDIAETLETFLRWKESDHV